MEYVIPAASSGWEISAQNGLLRQQEALESEDGLIAIRLVLSYMTGEQLSNLSHEIVRMVKSRKPGASTEIDLALLHLVIDAMSR